MIVGAWHDATAVRSPAVRQHALAIVMCRISGERGVGEAGDGSNNTRLAVRQLKKVDYLFCIIAQTANLLWDQPSLS